MCINDNSGELKQPIIYMFKTVEVPVEIEVDNDGGELACVQRVVNT